MIKYIKNEANENMTPGKTKCVQKRNNAHSLLHISAKNRITLS